MGPDPNNLSNSLGFLTGKVHRAMREAMGRALAEEGIEINTSYLPFIGCMVMRKGEPMNQSELTEVMGMDRHRVSRMVKEFQDKNWVQTAPNAQNRRENRVELTAEGKSFLPAIAACVQRVHQGATQGLSDVELDLVKNALNKINNNLNTGEL
jgi:DNA-binding MarR family transcriptional regulator